MIENGINVSKLSSMIETEPWGVKEQPKFFNMAVKIKTHFNPEELMSVFKKIEVEMGRGTGTRWGPRVIDLDVLLYDNLIMKTSKLEIPHPGLSDREFVLKPLAEIAPEKVHPVLKKSMKTLLLELLKSKEMSNG